MKRQDLLRELRRARGEVMVSVPCIGGWWSFKGVKWHIMAEIEFAECEDEETNLEFDGVNLRPRLT
jgi:hypothetical protein